MKTKKQKTPFMASLFLHLTRDVASRWVTENINWKIGELKSHLHREGEQFLTVQLPAWCKTLESSIHRDDRDYWEVSKVPLLTELFDLFWQTRDPALLRDLRQLSYLFYKYELPYSEETSNKVLRSFVEVDSTLPEEVKENPIVRYARAFITRVLHGFDHLDISPKHGPGAVATGERTQQKSVFKRIYARLEQVYPHCEYFRFSLTHVADRLQEIQALQPHEAGTAKVVLVPKDSRGPRLISCEPLEYQWIQQGLGQKLAEHLERHRLTAGHVNFTDQSINQRLALIGSIDNSWSTLDMKEASDRVSLALVKELFCGTQMLAGLLACRTPDTRLPNGTLVHMKKFAPMGSALCFPVESLVFYALAVATLKVEFRMSLKQACSKVYVYGDDIVVENGLEGPLFDSFSELGLMFNHSKCCYTHSHFRESCGVDAYKGVNITPIKIRRVWTSPDPTTIASYISYANSLMSRGYQHAALYLADLIEDRWGPIAVTTQYKEPSPQWDPDRERTALALYVPGVNAVHLNRHRLKTRYNFWLQRNEVLVHTLRTVMLKTRQDGWEELLRKTQSRDMHSRVGCYPQVRRAELKRTWVEELL